MDRDVAASKLLGRRHCSLCGGSFNTTDVQHDGFDMPPILPTKTTCPRGKDAADCTEHLIKRDDDTMEIIHERFRVYDEQTDPVLAYFRAKDMLRDFSVKKGVADSGALWDMMAHE